MGGQRQITLGWTTSPDTEPVEHAVYRADSAAAAADIRRMTRVHQAVAPPGSAAAELVWTDSAVAPLRTYYYRVVATSASGLVSAPSAAAAARAFDQSIPEPPAWVSGAWSADRQAIDLHWAASLEPLEKLVFRRAGDFWLAVSGWLPPEVDSFRDRLAAGGEENRYRLRVRNEVGTLNDQYSSSP